MIDAHERALLEEGVLAAVVRARASGESVTPIDATLAQLGWPAILEEEPRDAVEVVFRALGASDAAATALDDVLAVALGVEPRGDLAVLLPRFGAWDPPGQLEGDTLRAEGLATARASLARQILVVCGANEGPRIVVVPTTAAQVRRVHGVDPGAELHEVSLQVPAASAKPIDAWESAVAAGRRAIACQIAGATRTMLTLARTHALERAQFGQPIAGFQAVRHRLADALVAVESLDAAVSVAGEEGGVETAALAKAVAGRTAHTVSKHCQQVLAGIGFTTEHAFHRLLKRTMVLDGLFGSGDAVVLDIGRRLLATRRVPRLIEL